MNSNTNLSPTAFSILLALSLRPRHGYGLLSQIEEDSSGLVRLSVATLYSTLKQLDEANFIEGMPSEKEGDRRRYYRLTRKGWNQLAAMIPYHEHVLALAHARHIIPPEVP